MKFTILCAGKLKESYFSEAAKEYQKRISKYASVEIIEVADGPDMKAEAERFIKYLPEKSYKVTLEIEGKSFSSEEFAQKIEELTVASVSNIVFIIGGSDGLDKSIRQKADLALSFSKFTFPHMLMRVILLEQIYRAMKIINNEPYHK